VHAPSAQRTLQAVESRQSIATGQPEAGQSMEQATPLGHLMSLVQGLHAVPHANVQTPFTQLPPAAAQAAHPAVSVGPQFMPLVPALPVGIPIAPAMPMGMPIVPPVPVPAAPPPGPLPAMLAPANPPPPPLAPTPVVPAAPSPPVPATAVPAAPVL